MTTNFYQSLFVGVLAGSISGLLGTSSGGIIVPALTVLFYVEQHLAQMISLAAQVLPSALPGLLIYQKKGHSINWRIVLIIAVSFSLGGILGAKIANSLSSTTLGWLFILYLMILAAIMMKKNSSSENSDFREFVMSRCHIKKFIVVGLIGGISSGVLGVGGGLAITVLSIGLVQASQHQAQAISLAVSVLPLTLPAVWVYVQNGEELPWKMLIGVVTGLIIGTVAGAHAANKLKPEKLRMWFIAIVILMALGMAWRLI